MKKILISMMIIVAMLGACSANQQDDTTPDGALQQGERVIHIDQEFSQQQMQAYRGETVRIVYSGEGALSVSASDFDAQAEGTDQVAIIIKAKEIGDYEVTVCRDAQCKTGILSVVEYEQKDVYKNVDTEEFIAQMHGNYVLLDVRTEQEYAEGHIDGAVLIPHTALADRLSEIEGYDKVLVYCRSGNRSIAASQILVDAGFSEVYNLNGGFSAYSAYQASQSS